MSSKLFTAEQVLERTPIGHAALQQRTSALSPKLRAVLYLIDGERTLAALLDGVGSMAELISSQIETLGQMGLLQLKERRKEPRELEISGAALMAAKAMRAANAEPQESPKSNFFNASQFGDVIDVQPTVQTKRSAESVHPLMGAKLELLALLEKLQADHLELLASRLLEPKSLKELAFRTKEIANELELVAGSLESQVFWTDAKAVLMHWRDQNNFG